ncbi:MarR family winged helix-turn-helix transcriptional regulator [Aestuariispira insulae]|uniref:MarR family transcriptional regulator n=1 Tax=Aestuariispira insulae TaxID=1461337 RepID=A0A3D9HI58_9PROT|nr:MarR family transcriptional regulator [Aestuariispira insulae]RED49148.1 MarR family transcriptional regulator [Aestuariispira insulae]
MTEKQDISPSDDRRSIDPLLLDSQLCFSLYSTMHAFNKTYRRVLKGLDLTYPQYLVMLVLWERDELNVSDICDRLRLETTTVTPLLKRLEGRGVLRRERSKQDERQVIISLTDVGRTLKEQARNIPHCMAEALECSLDEMIDLQGRLDRIRENLSKHL